MTKNKPTARPEAPTVIDASVFKAASQDPRPAEFVKAATEFGRKLVADGRDFSRASRG